MSRNKELEKKSSNGGTSTNQQQQKQRNTNFNLIFLLLLFFGSPPNTIFFFFSFHCFVTAWNLSFQFLNFLQILAENFHFKGRKSHLRIDFTMLHNNVKENIAPRAVLKKLIFWLPKRIYDFISSTNKLKDFQDIFFIAIKTFLGFLRISWRNQRKKKIPWEFEFV
jgi:hypothetical protein